VLPDARITSTVPGSHCSPGQVVLQALATDGVIRWYDESYGGTLLDTGTVFMTDTLFSSATYYAEASNAGCTSFRNSVIASIITIPSIVSTLPQSRVGPGSVILAAYPSAGNVEWYDDSLAGNHLYSGTSFLTPYLTQTTTFYAEALYKGCASYPRTAVIATIPNSINDPYNQYKVTIYPNPAYDFVILSIEGLNESITLEIRDMQGRLIKTIELTANGNYVLEKIELSGFDPGMYHLVLRNERWYKILRFMKI
jgi:hypothetical protein